MKERGASGTVLAPAVVALALTSVIAAGPSVAAPAPRDYSLASPFTRLVTIDMVNARLGFAVAGVGPGAGPAYVLATSNGGITWNARGALPFTLARTAWTVPHLDFVSTSVGYADANVAGGSASDRQVVVTTDAGATWRPLAFTGETPTFATSTVGDPPVNPSYQVAAGVLTMVTLRCTRHELTADGGNWCSSYLDEFRVGALRPFKVEPIPSREVRAGSSPQAESVRLIAATGSSSAIVAVGDMEGAFPDLETSNGGSTWTAWSSPCSALRGSTGVKIAIPVQDLRVSPTGWYVTCYLGGGMSQGTLYLGRSTNGGRSWTLLSQGSEGASAGGLPFVGTIGDTDVDVWESHNGAVLWSWDRYVRGSLSFSTDGGRRWSPISTPGSRAPTSNSSLSFDPVGATGAVAVFPDGATYSTSQGRTWTREARVTSGQSSSAASKDWRVTLWVARTSTRDGAAIPATVTVDNRTGRAVAIYGCPGSDYEVIAGNSKIPNNPAIPSVLCTSKMSAGVHVFATKVATIYQACGGGGNPPCGNPPRMTALPSGSYQTQLELPTAVDHLPAPRPITIRVAS